MQMTLNRTINRNNLVKRSKIRLRLFAINYAVEPSSAVKSGPTGRPSSQRRSQVKVD